MQEIINDTTNYSIMKDNWTITFASNFSILLDSEKYIFQSSICAIFFAENHGRIINTIIYINTYSNILIGMLWYLIAN